MSFRLKKYFVNFLSKINAVNYFWKRLPNGLYVFNYHRIGDAQSCQFDRAVFSCSVTAFEQHIKEISENFIVIDTVKLNELIANNKLSDDRYALVTFDDGYLDNFTDVLPIMQKYAMPGVFYLVTDFLNEISIPWWDEIAYILRHSIGKHYQLPNGDEKYHLVDGNIDQVIRHIMLKAKKMNDCGILDVLADIRKTFPDAYQYLKKEQVNLLMNWDHAQALIAGGMEIGSHTNSHPILSQLTDSEQLVEIASSKELLEQRLKTSVNSIAYPVGRYHCYNEKTFQYTQSSGYQIAFNNEPGSHKKVHNKFDINRYCVVADDINFLKFDCCL